MNGFVCLVGLLSVTAVFADPAPTWPFIILRSSGTYLSNRVYMDRVFAAQERHPGLIEEIWFCGDKGFASPEAQGRLVGEGNLPAKELCRAHGIRFSFQQGVTLGHGPDDIKRPGFPDDAWVVDREGKTRYGVFCCTSPFVKDFSREKAKAIMSVLHPDSYWPDDDLRLNKLPNEPSACFCARCLRLFGERVGKSFDRAGLLAALDGPDADPEMRRAWCRFNGEMLGEYAKVYRAAADEVSPQTRVCQQSPYALSAVNGEAYRHILTAYDGEGVGTGVRPGGGYYSDQYAFDMVRKAICVAKDAARTTKLPCVKQVCYEAENWPHIGALKSPGGMMSECAYVIAAGCDSLALYWGYDKNGESSESYDFFFDTLAEWKPFLLSMRDAFRGTSPGGVAWFLGEGRFASRGWVSTMDVRHSAALARNALPMADQEARPDAYSVNASAVESLYREDLPRAFSKAVLMDVAAFQSLARRFPDLAFVKKVRIDEPLANLNGEFGFERFGSRGECMGVVGMIRPLAPDVKPFSVLTADEAACGTCVIPTEFGGSVVLVQDMAFAAPEWAGPQQSWAGCRRHGILDALDRAVPGGLSVRLMTDGYACAIIGRKTADGRTGGAFVINLGTGETPPLDVALRRGVTSEWSIVRPRMKAFGASCPSQQEAIVRLPPLPAFGVAAIIPEMQ